MTRRLLMCGIGWLGFRLRGTSARSIRHRVRQCGWKEGGKGKVIWKTEKKVCLSTRLLLGGDKANCPLI